MNRKEKQRNVESKLKIFRSIINVPLTLFPFSRIIRERTGQPRNIDDANEGKFLRFLRFLRFSSKF